MIRQPSTSSQLYAWHRAALANPDLPRHDGIPEAGWYKRRMVRGGPWVVARIWCEREIDPETLELAGPERLRCEVGGEPASAIHQWPHLKPITREEYDRLAAALAADPIISATHAAVDLTLEPSLP